MYLGIDFLFAPSGDPFVVDINVGLPGGAQEIDLTHRVLRGRPSGIFEAIESISRRAYGIGFKDYLESLPFMTVLKPFKLWLDGQGPFPESFHPGLRLEDKWIQYGLINPQAPMPKTMIFDSGDPSGTKRFLEPHGKIVLKRRLGRGGRGLKILSNPASSAELAHAGRNLLLQEFIDSRTDGYTFSVRALVFAGEYLGAYANLSTRSISNHGRLASVAEGDGIGLSDAEFETVSFNERSWEAKIWFGEKNPRYLRHNLYEDEVARTALLLPAPVLESIRVVSVGIERRYESLDFTSLPRACFEGEGSQ
jgi:hypothetical protein